MKWYKRIIFRRWAIGVWCFLALLWDIGLGYADYEINVRTLTLIYLGGIAVAALNRVRRADLEEADECFYLPPVREQPWSSRLLGIGAFLLICLMWLIAGLETMISIVMLSSFLEALEIARMERRLGKPIFLRLKQTDLAAG